MIHFYTSNSFEVRFGILSHLLDRPRENLFTPETFVVPTPGMAQELTERLTLARGIFANYRFPFPNQFADEIFGYFEKGEEGGNEKQNFPESELFHLMIYEIVKEESGDLAELSGPAGKLAEDRILLNRAKVAAELLDQYSKYRGPNPEEIFASEPDGWQGRLFRKLRERFPNFGFGGDLERLRESTRIMRESPPPPERVFFFGLQNLPPRLLSVFDFFSRFCEIHWFHFSPSPHFWMEAPNALRGVAGSDVFSEALPGKNPLLLRNAKSSRNYFCGLMEAGVSADFGEEHFAAVFPETLLGRIQEDVFENRSPCEGAYPFEKTDLSLAILSAADPVREVENLYNFLCVRFSQDPELSPEDVLILLPYPENYAPLIEAIFGTREPKLPFFVEHRERRADSFGDCVAELLSLFRGRFGLDEVFSLLAHPALSARFDLSAGERGELEVFFREIGVRWGLNADHRLRSGVAEFEEFSWEWGLDRLLLGVMMESGEGLLFAGKAPVELPHRLELETVEKFLSFWFAARKFVEPEAESRANRQRTGAEWLDWLLSVLDEFFPERERKELAALRAEIADAGGFCAENGLEARLDYSAFLSFAAGPLGKMGQSGHPGSRAGICFTDPVRRQGLEYKVIGILGLDDASFPGSNPLRSYDLMGAKPLATDPDPRAERRWLFLQSLLNARECFYAGFSQEERPEGYAPLMVEELLDAVQKGLPKGCSARDLIRRSPRYAFEPENYAADNPWRNFAKSDYAHFVKTAAAPEPFLNIEYPPETLGQISFSDLIAALSDPAKFFLGFRFNLQRDESFWGAEPDELFEPNSLESWGIGELWKNAYRGLERDRCAAILKASGKLPPKEVGNLVLEKTAVKYPGLELPEEKIRPEVYTEISLGACLLHGTLDNLTETGAKSEELSKEHMGHFIKCWVKHLAQCCHFGSQAGSSAMSVRAGKGKGRNRYEWMPLPPAEAAGELEKLVEIFHRNLSRPLPFFKKTASHCFNVQDPPACDLEAALNYWRGTGGANYGESADWRVKLCFGEDYEPCEQFVSLCREILSPIFNSSYFRNLGD